MTEQTTTPGAWVIAVGSVKGGVNKSTTSIHLAVAFHKLGRKTLLIDTDKSARTARQWQQAAADRATANGEEYDGPTVSTADDPNTVRQAVPKLRERFDVIVIDGAAMADVMIGAMFAVADLVISPATASQVTLTHALDTVDAATAHRARYGHPQAAVLFSNVKPRTTLYRERRAEAEAVAPVLAGCISNSTPVEEAMDASQTVWDRPGSKKAIGEFNNLARQCIELLNGQHPLHNWAAGAEVEA